MKSKIVCHWNGRAVDYDKNVRNVIYSHREQAAWQKIFSEALGKGCHDILDVGTGPGIVANLLAGLGHNVIGIDSSENMLKRAAENSAALYHSLEFVQGDAENLPFEDNSFDAVVNRYVLWSLPDPKRALSEWRRVLRRGGRLAIVDGTWYDRKDKPPGKRMWQNLSVSLIILTEHRMPHYQKLNEDLRDNLWSSNVKRPDADVELLTSTGFKEVDVVEGLNRKLFKNLDYLKNGHAGERFLVTGLK
jgi:ubiquinone/menaquinone biosynthesis C-methylase UbiE